MCPLLALPNPRFLLQPFAVLARQKMQAVRAIKQSISLDVYGSLAFFVICIKVSIFTFTSFQQHLESSMPLLLSEHI